MTDRNSTPNSEHLSAMHKELFARAPGQGNLREVFYTNIVRFPQLRLIGFTFLAAAIFLHNRFILGQFSWESFLEIFVIMEAYALLSWLCLYLFFKRVRLFDLGVFFFAIDLVVWTLAIYYSGGERSWLFFILVLRSADQSFTNVRRTLSFAHFSTFCYLALFLYLAFVERREISWASEVTKLFLIYSANIYMALTAVTANQLRRRTLRAMRMTGRLIVELEKSTKKAEEASRAKSHFLANMSHELRTPLNSVIGFASVMLRNKDRKLKRRDLNFLERIVENGKHLLELINQLLDLSKIEAGPAKLKITSVSLSRLVKKTVNQLEGEIRDKPVRLTTSLPRSMTPIQTDEQMLRQVLINLLGNALKFTEKGAITVSVQLEQSTKRPVQLDVQDTGPGIPQDQIERIFDPFHQVDSGQSKKHEGTGLGLSIARTLCHSLGYQLEVQSKLGEGSTFSVILNGTTENTQRRLA